jgi:hypothetical protein
MLLSPSDTGGPTLSERIILFEQQNSSLTPKREAADGGDGRGNVSTALDGLANVLTGAAVPMA